MDIYRFVVPSRQCLLSYNPFTLIMVQYTTTKGTQKITVFYEPSHPSYREGALLFQVIDSIERFMPTKKWGNEDSYHKELLGWLKQSFPNIQYELQIEGSRPDLVIENIAIEIKGPTDNQALNTLATKILKYSHHYDHVIIVLFETTFSERNFQEISSGIEKTYSHVHVVRK
jgi:hypothetical protein